MLEGLHRPYAIIGAHAVNAWLEPRFTADIDVTIELTAESSRDLIAAFGREGFVVARAHGERLPSGPDFLRFTSHDRLVTIEFQPAKTSLQVDLVQRAKRDRDGVRIATPEDLIVLKLIASRPKDQVDLLGLVRLPDLDWPYVERVARDWDLASLLSELRARAND